MSLAAVEILGLTLAILGWSGSILVTVLPSWQVSAHIEGNIVVAQTSWRGLWMNCVVQSTGQMQCKVHDSVLALHAELQAGRTLMVLGVLLGLAALLVTVVGAQCTVCLSGSGGAKAWVARAGGALFLLCGLLVLIPPSWFAHIVITTFHDPNIHAGQKMELGPALYLGWACAALLFIGGALIVASARKLDAAAASAFPVKYSAPRRPGAASVSGGAAATANGDYDKKNYV
ncbi:claudin-5 [Hemicordylus capensis]|uniref:claudin-5 n=1 Tax=Hemicordylus capensis TaxID=884348 RepID=UPI00230490B4|nr:claudin-5 [Hemicordylus capensis]